MQIIHKYRSNNFKKRYRFLADFVRSLNLQISPSTVIGFHAVTVPVAPNRVIKIESVSNFKV